MRFKTGTFQTSCHHVRPGHLESGVSVTLNLLIDTRH